jgi:hypothetical protein
MLCGIQCCVMRFISDAWQADLCIFSHEISEAGQGRTGQGASHSSLHAAAN